MLILKDVMTLFMVMKMSDNKCVLCDIDPIYDFNTCKDCWDMYSNMAYDFNQISHMIMIKKIRNLIDKSAKRREIDYIRVPVLPNTKKYDKSHVLGYDIIFDNRPLKIFYKDQTVWRTV